MWLECPILEHANARNAAPARIPTVYRYYIPVHCIVRGLGNAHWSTPSSKKNSQTNCFFSEQVWGIAFRHIILGFVRMFRTHILLRSRLLVRRRLPIEDKAEKNYPIISLEETVQKLLFCCLGHLLLFAPYPCTGIRIS